MTQYVQIDKRLYHLDRFPPITPYNNMIWMNLSNFKLLRYNGTEWVTSHDHNDYYSLLEHIHSIAEIINLSDKIQDLQNAINSMTDNNIYIGYFDSYQSLLEYTATDISEGNWVVIAKDETRENKKTKYIYNGILNSWVFNGEINEDSLYIDDSSTTSSTLSWSSKKQIEEFNKRKLIIQDTEPSKDNLVTGAIWMLSNPKI